jgi:hypothetical protein
MQKKRECTQLDEPVPLGAVAAHQKDRSEGQADARAAHGRQNRRRNRNTVFSSTGLGRIKKGSKGQINQGTIN